MGKFSQFIYSSDRIPCSPPDEILNLKKEYAEAKEDKCGYRIYKSSMRLACALVHSRQPQDRQDGIGMLEASLINTDDPCQRQQILYLLAVGHYRSGDYPTSMHYLGRCLKIAPNYEVARSLKKTIEEQCAKGSWTEIGIAVGGIVAVGGLAAAVCGTGVVGGMAAVVTRRCLIYAAGGILAAYGIVTANRMAASDASAHQN